MAIPPYFSFNPLLPTVTGFLGAVTFASMILMTQFPDKLQFSEILIPLTAIVSVFFIFATLGGSIDQRNAPLISQGLIKYVQVLFSLGILGMMIILPMIVYSFTWIGAIVLVAIEIIAYFLYLKLSPGLYDPHKES